jgi:branched-chain amino acid transport system substrate-binding protein
VSPGRHRCRPLTRHGRIRSARASVSDGGARLLAGLLGLALLVTACGSGKAGVSPGARAKKSPAPAAVPAAAKPAGSPIKIGMLSVLTGPFASVALPQVEVAKAWAKWTNAHGGISGHPVQLYIVDGKEDPATALQVAHELVQSDHVVAIVSPDDTVTPAWSSYVTGTGVPVISAFAGNPQWFSNPLMFPLSMDFASSPAADVAILAKYGQPSSRLGVAYCSEVPTCASLLPTLKSAATRYGFKDGLVPVAISQTATDYTAACLRWEQSGAKSVMIFSATVTIAKVAASCGAQGYFPTWGVHGVSVGAPLLALKDFTSFGVSDAFNLTSPTAATFNEAMKQYAAGDSYIGADSTLTWAGLNLLALAVRNSGAADPTAADIVTGLDSMKGVTLNGELANPAKFAKGAAVKLGSRNCYFVQGIKNGKIISPNNNQKECV